MQAYQQAFIEFAVETGVLKFGQFTLKSGRVSPYFFNAGLFQDGASLSKLGDFYAQALIASGIESDVLFGPAYKGIPLVSALAVSMATQHNQNLPWAFNRKEAKDHGEGGSLVGAPLEGKITIVDDVITAGTAIREVMAIMAQQPKAQAGAVLVAIDRQEKGQGDKSAVQEVEAEFGIPVVSIVSLTDVLTWLGTKPEYSEHMEAVAAYREQYGI
ncbi:orotate phosphoribosyltransferase [Salinibius halmophilus]|uniref:orotate phosphoribosyltransferase n=1 Tax=Salinibius halmophilus TaxID=1853216 RepID=UPI000E675FED|nr:orotate phosphoribosyltransferase [Salinibius halmophilus]